MKILLIGATGQVGQELARELPALGEVTVTTRSGECRSGLPGVALDVADTGRVEAVVRDLAPDLIVNASAYTAVDRAESDEAMAFRVNAEAPAAMARAAAECGARLVHYSTDYVFDGSASKPYLENAATGPVGAYGRSKLAGEEAVLAAGPRNLVLRTAWVYALHGQNFLRTMLRLGAERDELRVVADQVGSPTPAWFIAQATGRLVSAGVSESGIVHVVTGGQTSWHGFAEAIFAEAAARGLIARQPRVAAITTADFPTPATRPAYSVLDTSRLASAGVAVPGWREALGATFDRQAPVPGAG